MPILLILDIVDILYLFFFPKPMCLAVVSSNKYFFIKYKRKIKWCPMRIWSSFLFFKLLLQNLLTMFNKWVDMHLYKKYNASYLTSCFMDNLQFYTLYHCKQTEETHFITYYVINYITVLSF